MKNKKQFRKKIQNNKSIVWLSSFLFFFPLVIGAIYNLPIKQIIAVDVGELLSYYGVAFGLLGSFLTYRHEKKKEEKEKRKQTRPNFVVTLERQNETFNLHISKCSDNFLSFLYVYDEFVSTEVKQQYDLKLSYLASIDETEKNNVDYNITMDSDILDKDGYPKYIQLLCDDEDGKSWNCCYYKINDCNKIFYYPREIEII